MSPRPSSRPEILAPAGTEESFAAALSSGADAVYLGLSEGFNARSRSTAFHLDTLPGLVERAHLANVRVYLTLNTLIFEPELPQLEQVVRRVVEAGVDALIVQDPATAFIARRLAPTLRLHASTQMTISSVEGARFAATLGMDRVVLPRELSSKEIALFTSATDMEAEVFVHGALCMAWSGQCLTSEAFSGRSANRGQCSQACRMPYEAVVDGKKRDFGDLRYLLSPQDLAAHEAVGDLMQAGVRSLKIEGRYKGPAYVTAAVDSYKNWIDALVRGVTEADRAVLEEDRRRAQLTFSRGGSLGFLGGDNHQTLVVATTPKHRGVELGEVIELGRDRVRVRVTSQEKLDQVLRPGMGIKFELMGRTDKEHDPENAPGGPMFSVDFLKGGLLQIGFGTPGPDLSKVRVGDRIRLTGDPDIQRDAERRIRQAPTGRIPLHFRVHGQPGTPLYVQATASEHPRWPNVAVESTSLLVDANGGAGLTGELLREKLGGLGGTPFSLAGLDISDLASALHLPVSELKRMRRTLVDAFVQLVKTNPYPSPPKTSCLPQIRAALDAAVSDDLGPAVLVPLCRTEEQLEAIIESNLGPDAEVELDWMEMVGLTRAVARARQAGLRVTLATVRVQKPGEEAYDRRIAGLVPDGVLVRHWGGLMHFSQKREGTDLKLHGDFSLNVTNSLTAKHLLGLGLSTVTASHDLDQAQLLALLGEVPRGRVALTLHHHISTFHNSHCVYAHLLSQGTDYKTCGRPCEKHRLALRDYAGHEHPVVVDVSCRNTVFNAKAQSAAPLVPRLLELGVRRFRVELVWETKEEVSRILSAYQKLLRGEITPNAALSEARVHERYGVTTPLRVQRKSQNL